MLPSFRCRSSACWMLALLLASSSVLQFPFFTTTASASQSSKTTIPLIFLRKRFNKHNATTIATTTRMQVDSSSSSRICPSSTPPLGGGAINEKERKNATDIPQQSTSTASSSRPSSLLSYYDPDHVRSHLFHSLEGMHRYPNYLARWNEPDMEKLESALQQNLDRVRDQRRALRERQAGIDQLVSDLLSRGGNAGTEGEGDRWRKLLTMPQTWDEVRERLLDPAASKAIFGSRMWGRKQQQQRQQTPPSVPDVANGSARVELDVGSLTALMDEEMPDVFSFPLLSKEFCHEVTSYVKALAQQQSRSSSSSSSEHQLGRRAAINLDTVGLQWVNDLLFYLVLRPISAHLFASTETGGADLDWRNGYVAGYSAQPALETATPRERLVSHTDDSEVTLNVCIGDEDGFEGGLLEFRGLRGTAKQGELLGTYQPEIGRAVIHAGRHFHDVTQVTAGNRFALILWARSWRGVRSSTCPCCWLNRRREGSNNNNGGPCMCGSKWN